jgi:hypothetical protein
MAVDLLITLTQIGMAIAFIEGLFACKILSEVIQSIMERREQRLNERTNFYLGLNQDEKIKYLNRLLQDSNDVDREELLKSLPDSKKVTYLEFQAVIRRMLRRDQL